MSTMKPLSFLLLLAGTLSRARPIIPIAEPRVRTYNLREIYTPRCDDDDDDCEFTVTKTKSQSSASASSSSTIFPQTNSQTHATIVALACIVGILILIIAVFILWRRVARRKEQGVRPYIEISEETDGSRPTSRPPQTGGEAQNNTEDPANLPPPVQPFLGVAPSVIHYRAFGDLQGHWEHKQAQISLNEPTRVAQFEARFDYAPPGYRSTETIALR
ncbi:hypothetical protein C8R45DRAFT_175897 [Mycena sanguinolenta]|nr:hypothetical protein C8R45DRAFT_175897 [Mycena sanguinolenta]